MAQSDLGQNKPHKQTKAEKERRELVRSWLFELLWFFLDVWFVWPISHIWAVVLFALGFLIHFATSSWRTRIRWTASVLLVACAAVVIYFLPPTETETHGFLMPGDEPFPQGPCQREQDGLLAHIYFGGNEEMVDIGNVTTTISAVSVFQHPVLQFQVTKSGLNVSGDIYGVTGEVATLVNNEFWLNPNLTFRSEHPDAHTLIVRDNTGSEVLFIRYLNKRAVTFRCHFFFPENGELIVSDNGVNISANRAMIYGNCHDRDILPGTNDSLVIIDSAPDGSLQLRVR